MEDVYIGTIILFAGKRAPHGWEFCHGQLLQITSNQPLYALIGTTYGGDGRTTFALPDLRGRMAVGAGQGPGLSPRSEGEKGGAEFTTLSVKNMPAHNHTIAALDGPADQTMPTGHYLAGEKIYASRTDTTLGANAVGTTGGGQPFSIMPPFLGINYIIAVQGQNPERD